jgi:hypothetical protein
MDAERVYCIVSRPDNNGPCHSDTRLGRPGAILTAKTALRSGLNRLFRGVIQGIHAPARLARRLLLSLVKVKIVKSLFDCVVVLV